MAGLAEYTRTLSVGAAEGIGVRGNFIRVKETSGTLEVTTRQEALGNKSGEQYKLPMKKFEKLYAASEFDKVEIRNTDVADITVVLQIGYGDFEAEIISRTQAAKNLVVSSFDQNTLAPGAGPTVLVAENLQRKRAVIQVTRITPQVVMTFDNGTPKATLDWTAAKFVSGLIGGYEVWRLDNVIGGETWADLLGSGAKLTTTAGNILTYDDLAVTGVDSYMWGIRALEINTGLLPAGGRKRSNLVSRQPA